MVTFNNSLYAEADIIALSGNTFDAVLQIFDGDNVAVDLSNYTLVFTIYKQTPMGKRVMDSFINGDGFTVAGNEITFDKLIQYSNCELDYELIATNINDGSVKTLLKGKFIVE